jgi:formylglycine-generating enzyme required for sulfatase activity
MGCNEAVDPFCDEDEHPFHEVFLSAFLIDKFETTQAEYFDCVLAGECEAPAVDFDPESYPDFPVLRIVQMKAKDYCLWRGKRLCTEAEWEKAARGMDGRRYPWGNEPATCARAVKSGCGYDDAVPPGSLPAGQSPYGVLDMAGNVWEWVDDRYDPDFYSQCQAGCTNPRHPFNDPDSQYAVVRGGDVYSWSDSIRTSDRYWISLDNRCGIRCCSSVP